MTYLLDTNVVSELRRAARADRNVAGWAARVEQSSTFLSVMSGLEIELGIRLVERRDPWQATVLRDWLEQVVLPGFADRVLSVDMAVARLSAALHVPDPRPERDALIAATALIHDLTLVTRNTRDFAGTGVRLLDPWEPA